MGSTINPRARGGASLSGELRASRDDRQQIRRLFQATPKPKPEPAAAAPSGGGSVAGVRHYGYGTASGGTTSLSINFDPSASHAPQQIGPNPAPAFTPTASGDFVAATAGYYSFDLTAQLNFSGDPGKVYLSWLSSGFDASDPTGPLYITQTWSHGSGQYQVRDSYRAYLAAGESMNLGFAWDNATTAYVWSAEMDIFRLG